MSAALKALLCRTNSSSKLTSPKFFASVEFDPYNSCSVYTIHNFPLTSTQKHCLPLSCHIDFSLSVFNHVLILILFAFTFTDDFPSPPEVCIIFYMLHATCICFKFISNRVQIVHVGGGRFIHDDTGRLINDSCCHNICNVFRLWYSVYRWGEHHRNTNGGDNKCVLYIKSVRYNHSTTNLNNSRYNHVTKCLCEQCKCACPNIIIHVHRAQW